MNSTWKKHLALPSCTWIIMSDMKIGRKTSMTRVWYFEHVHSNTEESSSSTYVKERKPEPKRPQHQSIPRLQTWKKSRRGRIEGIYSPTPIQGLPVVFFFYTWNITDYTYNIVPGTYIPVRNMCLHDTLLVHVRGFVSLKTEKGLLERKRHQSRIALIVAFACDILH